MPPPVLGRAALALLEMRYIILRIISYAAMSEALWLWRYKPNSVCFRKSVF